MKHETIVIEGNVDGVRFSKTLQLTLDDLHPTVESAIISFYESDAESFDMLALEKGWRNYYWTYESEDLFAFQTAN